MATEYSEHTESKDKQPRTARGLKTKRKLLDAAALEFGEKGFHEASITGITQRAGTALGSFYTYFDSKDELFSALVKDMSARASYRLHYEETAKRIFERLQEGSAAGDFRGELEEAHAWAIMGMNVFLGMRYGIWSEEKSAVQIADIANGILAKGIAADKD